MTIRHLKVFIEVYKTENITKAANNLFITQPTVTRAIQELEDYYGVQLFERINHKLFITESGHLLYSHALHIIDSLEKMDNELKNWDECGVLKIGATPPIASVMIPSIINKFKEKYPKLTIKCKVCDGDELQKCILNNDLDFVFFEGITSFEHLEQEEIDEDKLVLILPPNDERKNLKHLKVRDLKNDNFLLREPGSTSRSFIEHILSKHGIVVNPIMESISTHALVQAVHANLGISFLPEKLVYHSIESGFVSSKTIDDENLVRKIYIAWHDNKFLTKSSKEFIEICKNITI